MSSHRWKRVPAIRMDVYSCPDCGYSIYPESGVDPDPNAKIMIYTNQDGEVYWADCDEAAILRMQGE